MVWNIPKHLGSLSTLVMGEYFINQALKKPGLSLTLVMGIIFSWPRSGEPRPRGFFWEHSYGKGLKKK
jgi:hypothetical protein